MNKTEYKVVIWENGRQEWRNDKGKWHRLDGPAFIEGDYQAWWANGKRHRLDGPAFIEGDYQAWYNNGKLHRLDGPAIIEGGYQAWWIEGKRHRLDGPAVIAGVNQEWWIEGKEYTQEVFNNLFLCKMAKTIQQTIPEVKTILIDGIVYKIERLEGQ